MYTDVQVGMLDGPGRYLPKPDPTDWRVLVGATTDKARMTKRQRKAARKARRAAARAQKAAAEALREVLI